MTDLPPCYGTDTPAPGQGDCDDCPHELACFAECAIREESWQCDACRAAAEAAAELAGDCARDEA